MAITAEQAMLALWTSTESWVKERYNMFYNPTPMDVTIKDMPDENGNLRDVTFPNLAKEKKKVDDFIHSTPTLQSFPSGYFNQDGWKTKLTRIGRITKETGGIDFVIYSKTDYNYPFSTAARVTFSTYAKGPLRVSIKALQENQSIFVPYLYSFAVDKDGYIYFSTNTIFTLHNKIQIINTYNFDITLDGVSTWDEIVEPQFPVTVIKEQNYENRDVPYAK